MTQIQTVITAENLPIGNLTPIVGGKANNLLRLQGCGFPVPPFFAIAATSFQNLVESDSELATMIDGLNLSQPTEVLNKNVQSIRQRIGQLSLPPSVQSEIKAAFADIIPSGQFVAVRSSASDEDGSDHSFAGMHDSFLFVNGTEEVLEKVKLVWASAFNERAIAYRLENALNVKRISVAVVVQQMIDATSSGVIFTCNPGNGRTDQIVVSSVFGIGEGLVSGGLAADTFVVDKRELNIESDVAPKTHQMIFDMEKQSGLMTVELDACQTKTPAV